MSHSKSRLNIRFPALQVDLWFSLLANLHKIMSIPRFICKCQKDLQAPVTRQAKVQMVQTWCTILCNFKSLMLSLSEWTKHYMYLEDFVGIASEKNCEENSVPLHISFLGHQCAHCSRWPTKKINKTIVHTLLECDNQRTSRSYQMSGNTVWPQFCKLKPTSQIFIIAD